ncbi:4-alpha-glucanotransferase chloroplastic/amyloplastic [Bienertia sinuspersici]
MAVTVAVKMASLNTFSLLPQSPLMAPKLNLHHSRSLSFSSSSVAAESFSAVVNSEVGEDLPLDYDEYLPNVSISDRRRAGILLHPTSLPGPHGIGDFGEQAFRFIDWLHSSGCSLWQVLPLVPPGRKANEEGSPYSGQDANCGNTLLISLEELVKDGLLHDEELPEPINAERVNYDTIAQIKDPLVAKAAERLIESEGKLKNQLQNFRKDPDISSWLEDAAYFAAIDNVCDAFSWCDWPEPLKNRHLSALVKIYQSEKHFIDLFIAQQFLFQRQWKNVRNYAKLKGIKIMGDMPIYVGYHSADVWANKKTVFAEQEG